MNSWAHLLYRVIIVNVNEKTFLSSSHIQCVQRPMDSSRVVVLLLMEITSVRWYLFLLQCSDRTQAFACRAERRLCVSDLSGRQQARGQCQHQATSQILSTSFISSTICCCPRCWLLVEVCSLVWDTKDKAGRDVQFITHVITQITWVLNLFTVNYQLTIQQFINYDTIVFDYMSDFLSPSCCSLWGADLNKAVNKQSMREVFTTHLTHRPRDANEISHGLTVEEIELPCLLLDWRNALLMHWGAELNGEGGVGDGGEGVAAPSDPPSLRHFLSLAGLSAWWLDHRPLSDSVFSVPGGCMMARRHTSPSAHGLHLKKCTDFISLDQTVGSIQAVLHFF